jgi:citrate lyase gamma subunit
LTNVGATCGVRIAQEASVATDEFIVIAYPNPSSSEFTIDVQSSSKEKQFGVKVYDLLGRLIEEQHIKEPTLKIGSNYQSGTYILQVSQGENQKTLQVIKN